eukprot:CAMPEP_0171498428 /NCGR_PEP_ID=MMETSP0958-20121227/7845_1 /TAXON_ID=87120 /ORGANISM="Aurantiochytrium limacinum, Strain ATCCMYA-1381" /LENGTH=40 /DNA_ID= /DNA_START= /DNA_END= /DNA_ORIENTATION=
MSATDFSSEAWLDCLNACTDEGTTNPEFDVLACEFQCKKA